MIRRTKIVATLGPATEDEKQILKLVKAGLSIARINFSHGTYEQAKKMVKNIHLAEKKTGKMIGVLQDLQGPKIRLGKLPVAITVKKGQKVYFTHKTRKMNGDSGTKKDPISIPCAPLPKVLKKGHALLIEDGMIRTEVLSVKNNLIEVEVKNDGVLKAAKGVNLPDTHLPSSASLSKKDKEDLKFGVKTLKVDAIAVSFVEDVSDIIRVRKEIAKHTKRDILVIAKIERKDALKNIESIIEEADGIMVARGDLGIETPAERVPIEQKRILNLARQSGKPVIIATQILQSMVENPLPTRAEMSDAATAIFDHADAFMLSNETAVGKYPIKAVETLAKVAMSTEHAIFNEQEIYPVPLGSNDYMIEDEALSLNACHLAEDINAQFLIIRTKEGYTARSVVKHRPETPCIVVTTSESTARQLSFLWGIQDVVLTKGAMKSDETVALLRKKKLIKKGDELVLIKLSNKKRSLVNLKA